MTTRELVTCRECKQVYTPWVSERPCGVCEGLSDPWPDQMEYCTACSGTGKVVRGNDGFCDACEEAFDSGEIA